MPGSSLRLADRPAHTPVDAVRRATVYYAAVTTGNSLLGATGSGDRPMASSHRSSSGAPTADTVPGARILGCRPPIRARRPAPNRARSPSCGGCATSSRIWPRPSICRSSCCSCSAASSRACRCPSMPLDAGLLNERLAAPPILDVRADADRLERPAVPGPGDAAAMRKHEALEEDDCRRVEALSRDAARSLVRWSAAGTTRRAAERRWRYRRDRAARQRAAAGDAAVPDARRRRDHGADRLQRLAAGQLPAVRRRAGPGGHHAGGRAPADLRALHARAGASTSSPARSA